MSGAPKSTSPHSAGLIRSAAWFIVVGVANNALGYVVFVALSLVGTGPVVAATASYAVGMAISFYGNRKLTFRHSGPNVPVIIKFLVVNAVGYLINLGALWLFISVAGFSQITAQLFSIAFVAAWTFSLMRLWVFAGDRSSRVVEGAE